MDVADHLMLRADTAAEGFLAVRLQELDEVLDEDDEPLSEEQIMLLREIFKVAWMKGYGRGWLEGHHEGQGGAYQDMSNRLKGLVNE